MIDWLQLNLVALVNVIIIDVVLAGDNAIIVGLAASRVAPESRARVIFWGMAGAVFLRIAFAAVTVQLLAIVGLTLAGGILLLWVCWKMWRELRVPPVDGEDEAVAGYDVNADGTLAGHVRAKTFGQAAMQIVVADVSMSLDNVLAVAGAAREHPVVLVFGLLLSIALMGAAANVLARVLNHHRWIGYVGLVIIVYVAYDMIYRGLLELKPVIRAALALL
jgi:YjbE family integral membrane protein